VTEPLAWIWKTGARAPLGLSSEQVAMCVRANKMEPETTRFMDRSGEPIGACRTLAVNGSIHGYDRLLRLAAPALCEAWPEGAEEPIPLILSLPEAGRADDDPRFNEGFVRDLATRSRRRLDLERSRVVRAGRAGGAIAVEAAGAMLAAPGGPALVMVGGADSYYHPGVLAGLDRDLRLHGPGTEDGFIPGEGAAFVLLSRSRPKGDAPMAAIRRVVTGREATVEGDAPNIGTAMTEILHALRSDGPIPWVVSDLNGEQDRAREWTLADIRAFGAEEVLRDEPIGELGDVGAATGPLFVSIVSVYFAAGCAPAREAVIVLASDGADRGALRIEAAS
jgi:3-oxoacyl-[acyl-carrier-protein] synthase-1